MCAAVFGRSVSCLLVEEEEEEAGRQTGVLSDLGSNISVGESFHKVLEPQREIKRGSFCSSGWKKHNNAEISMV